MPNFYTNLTALKSALGIDVSATARHALLTDVMEMVARQIDDYVGFHFYESYGTRLYTPRDTSSLFLDYPLLTVEGIQTSSDGGSTYGSTMTSADYYLSPYNATMEDPPRPYWEIEVRSNATSSGAAFPKGIHRGARITGTWGYFNKTKSTSADLSTAATSNTSTLEITNATALSVGQTIILGTEKMFVTRTPGSSTGVHTSTVDVLRAQNGTTNSTHSATTGILIYEYPIIERAALYQAELDYRTKDAPMGVAGGEPMGTQPSRAIGLHPFTRRMLDMFRMPVAI